MSREKRTAEEAAEAGRRHRNRMAQRSRDEVVEVAEIGPPPNRDDELWEKYRFNLYGFLSECFPNSTSRKPFSVSHKRIIDRTQQAILEGGLELRVVYRGFAKSTIAENAAIWATGYGHRSFFLSIGADKEAALMALDSIQSEFQTNDNLMLIFPEVCHSVQALEGTPQRGKKQTIDGQLTHVQWSKKRCVLPTVPGFAGSGAIIECRGITASIRGMRFKRPDGTQARPDFVLVDDPQTDESAASPAQVNTRLNKLNKSILRLGGHERQIACVINATVIEPDDMIDQLSNAKLYPAWRVDRVPMLLSYSKAQDTHWLGPYAELRTTHNPDDDDDRKRAHRDATAFYEANQDVMDGGAKASWDHCYAEGDEVSAIQHAYNIIIDTTFDAFMAECQNTPVRNTGGLILLTPEQICLKQSDYQRDQFPAECAVLTCRIDVHPSILYYELWAWEPTFTGYCINYGTFPDQRRKYFSHSHLSRRLQHLFPGRDVDATVEAGLDALLGGCAEEGWAGLVNMEWSRADGVPMRIGRGSVDANGEAADAVKKVVRRYAPTFQTSFGKGVGAKGVPLSQWRQAKGARCNWPEATPVKGKVGEPPGYLFDTNYAKTRFHRALALPRGSKGSLYLFKTTSPNDHRRVADHWYSEKPSEVTVGSRTVYEFSQKAGTDNHDLDCAVGAMVDAGMWGISSVKGKTERTVTKSPAEWAAEARR